MAISRHGFQPRSCSRTGRNLSTMPCLRQVDMGVSACQQGLCRRACRRQGHGDKSRCAGCLCADHQRGEEAPAYPGISGYEPDLPAARQHADAIDGAMTEIRALLPTIGREQLLRSRMERIILGRELRKAACRERQVRSGRHVLRPPRPERWSGDGFTRLAERQGGSSPAWSRRAGLSGCAPWSASCSSPLSCSICRWTSRSASPPPADLPLRRRAAAPAGAARSGGSPLAQRATRAVRAASSIPRRQQTLEEPRSSAVSLPKAMAKR
jgi:hypothetical protein